MLPRMTLLETAAHGDSSLALTIGLIAFGTLFVLLLITVIFGSARPHTESQ